MSYRISGLSPVFFRHLFGLSEVELAARGARRCTADSKPGYPDRITLADAEPGETLLLVNYTHQPASTPYRASHAIFVSETATCAYDRLDNVPQSLLVRPLSLRAFDKEHMMIEARLAEGAAVEPVILDLLANPDTAYIHAHNAMRGCYAALIARG